MTTNNIFAKVLQESIKMSSLHAILTNIRSQSCLLSATCGYDAMVSRMIMPKIRPSCAEFREYFDLEIAIGLKRLVLGAVDSAGICHITLHALFLVSMFPVGNLTDDYAFF